MLIYLLLIFDVLEFQQVTVKPCMHLLGRLSVGLLLFFRKVCCNLSAGPQPVAVGFFIQFSHFTDPVEVKAAVQSIVCVFGFLEVPVLGVSPDDCVDGKVGKIAYLLQEPIG